MLHIFQITAPIFLLIALGHLLVRYGAFKREDMRVFGAFVIKIALPALLFGALARRSFAEVMNPAYLLAYGLASLIAMGAGYALARRARRMDVSGAAIVGMGCAMSNSAFIGLPVALQVVGPTASVAIALCMLVENLLMLPLILIIADGQGGGGHWQKRLLGTLQGLLRNPLIIAIAAGFAASLLALPIPQVLLRAVDMLSGASAALALIVIGGNLVLTLQPGAGLDAALVAFGKLAVHPAAAFVAVMLLPGIGPELKAAAVLFAAVPMLSIYGIFGQRYGREALCASALVGTTLAAFVSISVAIWLVHAMGWTS